MGLHEEFTREYQVEAASNRRFGLIVGAIVLAFGVVRAGIAGEVGILSAALCAAGFALMAAGLLMPDRLAPLNRGWSRLGLLLHKVTNPLFLGAMYLGAIIPTALVMRLIGVDPMGRRRRPGATYWTARSKPGSTLQSLQKPF